jgi:ATP-binding cassette subfamily B protein
VAPGERVAFVGPSGVGKSTIVKLLFRFFDVSAGRILIDDVDLRDLDKATRRRLFAIVPQEPALFNTTLEENIRFGKPEATSEEIQHAAELASIAPFIETLPEKYETTVGERGVKLSGGEKQRVAIARAIIREPKIVVFDEATSSLDSRSEKAIQKSLDTIAQGRTTIAVAHRLSTIAGSDMIYVLDHGCIAEQGTHAQLLAREGLYAKLWQMQSESD